MSLLHWYNLLKQLNVLRAQTSLEHIREISYPHMKSSARQSIDLELKRRIEGEGIDTYRQPISKEEYLARMLTLGIGFRGNN